jgi:hypothetical protein
MPPSNFSIELNWVIRSESGLDWVPFDSKGGKGMDAALMSLLNRSI